MLPTSSHPAEATEHNAQDALLPEVPRTISTESVKTRRATTIDDDKIMFEPEPLSTCLYGLSITSLIRDVRKLTIGQGRMLLRFTKVCVTIGVLWLTIGMQVFLMAQFKRLVTASAVHQIRETYNEYEIWMYDDHTELTVNGFHRGVPGFFNKDRFEDLPDHIDKDFVCSIPFSQPYFFVCILMVWSFTVVVDLRELQFFMDLMLIQTPTISSVQDMLEERGDQTVMLRGLTVPFKVLLFFIIFLPRILVDLVLLWLGCRWLSSTANFGDVLLNAIALEFILLLKDLIYSAVVPRRNQWETSTMLLPHKEATKASWWTYMGAFIWLLLVCIWVVVYMYRLQQVLPEYRWDIHDVCDSYITQKTSLTAS